MFCKACGKSESKPDKVEMSNKYFDTSEDELKEDREVQSIKIGKFIVKK